MKVTQNIEITKFTIKGNKFYGDAIQKSKAGYGLKKSNDSTTIIFSVIFITKIAWLRGTSMEYEAKATNEFAISEKPDLEVLRKLAEKSLQKMGTKMVNLEDYKTLNLPKDPYISFSTLDMENIKRVLDRFVY